MLEINEQEKLNMHIKLGKLEEKADNLEKRLNGLEKDINEKLEKIENKIDEQNKENKKTMNNILSEIHDIKKIEIKRSAKISVLTWIFSGLIILSGFLAWIYDRWDAIKMAMFGI